ncbi:TRAP transporter large permease [Radicibacter daui]|uniref:TRAP transporter large permease n=1 Tax=Radicibacter daui TaxID=3064829 RepID=UPI004046CFD5
MSLVFLGLAVVVTLVVLLGSGVWVAFSLAGIGLVALEGFTSLPVGRVFGGAVWDGIASWSLAPLPLFIWMGEILFRTRLSQDMFTGLAPWVGRLPGRLLHANVLGCGIFAAVSGSSAATAATIGRMTVPELRKRGYDDDMVLGTLAGSATLGFLIPPSLIMIVYGVSADVSIARLFMAGVVPGIVLIALFMGYIMVWSLLNRHRMPAAEAPMPFMEKVRASSRLFPVIALIVAVIGSIYVGIATPTEAAAIGVVGALLLSLVTGSLSFASFKESLMGATRTTCMIGFILVGAAFLTAAMGFTNLPSDLAAWIQSLHLAPVALIFALTLFFILAGCFLDGISIVVLTTSVVLPMVQAAGIDLMWFGIYLVIVVEMSQITPPVGFNLFVLQGLAGRDIFSIARAAIPFFLVLCLMVCLLVAFPGIATWLPLTMTAS